MTHISTVCVMSGTLAVFALSANWASAELVKVPRVNAPKISVHAPQPKVYSKDIATGGLKSTPKSHKSHKEVIEIESFSWGSSQTGVHTTANGGAAGAGKVNFGQIVVKKGKKKGDVSSYGIRRVNEDALVPPK